MTTPSLAEPIIVSRFWRNRQGEAVIVQLRKYQGRALVDVRVHFTDSQGKLAPTPKGLLLAVLRLPDLTDALVKATAKARELGLIAEAAP